MLQGAEFSFSYFGCLTVFSSCTRLFLVVCSMEFTGQRQCYLGMLNSEGGLDTLVRCRQSRYPLLCFLFVSAWLLLFLFFVVSLLLVDCSGEASFEVRAMVDCSSWKDVRELARGSDVGLLSNCCRNECVLMRLQCAMLRRFTLKNAGVVNA